MRSRVVLVLVAAALLVAGCGKDDDAPPAPGSSQLTVYSSLPLQGPSRVQSLSLVNAEKLALSESGGRVGPFTVKYVSLDDSRAKTGRWDPGAVLSNARRAVEDRTAIAYIGEADSGASAIAVPVLNSAGILTVSPSSTYPGLTTTESADKGEPEKYYPSGTRTFARVVPADNRQARVQVRLQQAAGCTKLFVVSDRDVYGRGIASAVAREASENGMQLVGEIPLLNNQKDFSDVAERVRKTAPDCVFTGVSLNDHASALYEALHTAAPGLRLFGPDALADSSFASKLTAGAASQTSLTSVALTGPGIPARAKSFVRAYRKRYGSAPEPYAIYGYEAMKAVLRAIKNTGNRANRRDAVLRSFFALRGRNSVLGRYSISPEGDTSLDRYAVQGIRGGRLTVESVMRSGH